MSPQLDVTKHGLHLMIQEKENNMRIKVYYFRECKKGLFTEYLCLTRLIINYILGEIFVYLKNFSEYCRQIVNVTIFS